MVDHPIALDEHRGLAEQRATDIRRRLAEVQADQASLRQRRGELEKLLVAAPAANWREVAEKARYLITILALTSAGREPRRQKIIDSVLEDFKRLSAEAGETPAENGAMFQSD
jgi:phage terminase Nu1 subunit (DNA packaging protein)